MEEAGTGEMSDFDSRSKYFASNAICHILSAGHSLTPICIQMQVSHCNLICSDKFPAVYKKPPRGKFPGQSAPTRVGIPDIK